MVDVGFNVGQQFVKGKTTIFGEVLHDGVKLKDLAVNVELGGNVGSLEKVVAEGEQVLQIGYFSRSAVPQHALEPLNLSF